MSEMQERAFSSAVSACQGLLSDPEDEGIPTTEAIMAKVDGYLSLLKPSIAALVDRERLVAELIRRLSTFIGVDGTLKNSAGHVDWLNSGRKKDWRYWGRYQQWLGGKLPASVIEALSESTDTVLGQLEDPRREGSWDRRGLVVGHVQSGKTGHYSGLVCKAADAGYKIIIVLAGLHNNLRSQTQMRLDEAFLGYETHPDASLLRPIGVGLVDPDPDLRPNYATDRTERGDFTTKRANGLGVRPEERAWLFVVKKNKTVLSRLLNWIEKQVADEKDAETGRRIVTRLPLLLIDDEADHGSLDTNAIELDADGQPDAEHDPTTLNSLVRRILHAFSRSAYVGYTATPFANIFVHERAATTEEGPDLFPSSFIVSLAAPSNYIGPRRIFGVPGENGREDGLPLVEAVDDWTAWMPSGHKRSHVPLHEGRDELPPSVSKAIDSFLLACAARAARGQGTAHASMLIHVTRFNDVQVHVARQVKDHVRLARQRLKRRTGGVDYIAALEALWASDFLPKSSSVALGDEDYAGFDTIPWNRMLELLPDVVDDIGVRTINGTAKGALDYADNGSVGLRVIAIGGDKLARGLTLEGLSTSYFLRASRMYDTLMQMGRWFGYRPGYLDLCRLYTTSELVEWFEHIADASEELRDEFDLMVQSGGTPRDFGLKVARHSTMMVTSRLKMRHAKELRVSFSGSLCETVSFRTDAAGMAANLAAARVLLDGCGPGFSSPVSRPRPGGKVQTWEGRYWESVPASVVIRFFEDYRTHGDALKADAGLIGQFIERMAATGELTTWSVAVIDGGHAGKGELAPGFDVEWLERNDEGEARDGKKSIGRLMSSRDEGLPLDAREWAVALEDTIRRWRENPGRRKSEPDQPPGPPTRAVTGGIGGGLPARRDRGFLFIYPVRRMGGSGEVPEGEKLIGFAASFPASQSPVTVSYMVNQVYWDQEIAGRDGNDA